MHAQLQAPTAALRFLDRAVRASRRDIANDTKRRRVPST